MPLSPTRRALVLAVLQKAVRSEIPAELPERDAIAGKITKNVVAAWLDLYQMTVGERDEAEAACIGLLPLIEAELEKDPRDPGHAYLRARAVAMLALGAGRGKPVTEG